MAAVFSVDLSKAVQVEQLFTFILYIVSTWMGDHQGRLSAVNLCPFVGVDLNL